MKCDKSKLFEVQFSISDPYDTNPVEILFQTMNTIFQEFLFFTLPLINFQRVKNFVRRHILPRQDDSSHDGLRMMECAVCEDVPTNPQEIGCPHLFCYYCIQVQSIKHLSPPPPLKKEKHCIFMMLTKIRVTCILLFSWFQT